MLIYEHDGFIEVQAPEIIQLCRSLRAVTFSDAEGDPFELHAVLCDSLENSVSRCRAAFYAKSLKRALVFAVKSPESQSAWQHGREVLTQLGFQLDDVNLKLSSAMLEVVLRDVPGITNPAGALKQRQENDLLLTALQKKLAEDSESAQGRKAALKLSAEKRLNERTEELRQLVESLLGTAENADADIKALASQVNDLNVRLEAAESLAETERSRREMSESITVAAEKRIQELEAILVDVETKSAQTLKEKRRIVKLQNQVKDLSGTLAATEEALAKERSTQEQFIADVSAAQERIAALETDLLIAEQALANAKVQLAAEQEAKALLENSLEEAGLRIANLHQEYEQVTEKAKLSESALKVSVEIKEHLADVQSDLQETSHRNQTLEKDLAASREHCEDLRVKLRQAEEAVLATARIEEQASALAKQKGKAVQDLEKLRDEYGREYSQRKRLEKAAAADEKQIKFLQDALAKAEEDSAARSVDEQLSQDRDRELTSLNAELQEQEQRCMQEKRARDDAETALQEAHQLIDSLEKMLRQTGRAESGGFSDGPQPADDSQKVLALEEQLKFVGAQLEEVRSEQAALTVALDTAERKFAEQQDPLPQRSEDRKSRRIPETVVDAETVAAPRAKSSKPLPHELRPAPKKGAFFRPDWDLQGLPCQSSEQVNKAWESVFNVQISLEGYTSQYCMAFLVVLRLGKQKRLYMLYRLKQDKHTLVCVPSETPGDESSLRKAIQEGLEFLRRSGFEMEEMAAENIDSTLGGYFLKG